MSPELNLTSADRATALITAAAAGDRRAFGQAYEAVIDPALDTEAVVALFTFIRAAYDDLTASGVVTASGSTPADPHDRAIEQVRRLALAAYPTCFELVEVNLVVLEHVLRSVLGLSSYLASIDGYTVALYLAALAGGLATLADEPPAPAQTPLEAR
jgi:hypothetical protein